MSPSCHGRNRRSPPAAAAPRVGSMQRAAVGCVCHGWRWKEAHVLDSSFDEFVEGHIAALDRYAYALTGDRHAADDLVQETLVRVAGAWRRVRRDGNPTGYATTVMFRTFVSIWRKKRRTPQLVELAV